MNIHIQYICPYWGQEHLSAKAFFEKVMTGNFQGIEINLPNSTESKKDFFATLELTRNINPDFIFIPQQLTAAENENVSDYIKRVELKLLELAAYQPAFINSHTGKDYFSFDDNCRVIEACQNISSKTGIKILHETHRGRFSFHTASLIPYLQKFPELELTGDFSHFCAVSESLLNDQENILNKIIPHVSYIHARVGYEQGPQVNNPFAPEWKNHLQQFTKWWDAIVHCNKQKGKSEIAICPEFGPAPYMPCLPFTKQPLANQWEVNVKLKEYLAGYFKK
ncbi:MAG: sugar phosphate isomerase/epimerase [Bacteroidetes bacterium]|nr:sugar phosphate isomerase/epimerase [Bacteroidota bacterium]MBS1756026.1 sugar phosphate isomerase/epimerase [Bacteroidota bacterium]